MQTHRLLYLVLIFLTACTDTKNGVTESAVKDEKQDTTESLQQNPSKPDTILTSIEQIQQAYKIVAQNKEKGALDSTTFQYNCNGEKSGTVTYFSEKGKLQLITHRYNEYSHHAAEDHYYINNEKPFFVFYNRLSWTFDSGPVGTTIDHITEQRIYLVNLKPIKCLEKKFSVRSNAKNNPLPETVANQEIDCSQLASVSESFAVLLKYQNQPPQSGCLDH